MANWVSVNTSAKDIKQHKDKDFVGEYVGKKDITTQVGPQVIWEFRDEDGNPFAIYGFTNLNRAMEHLAIGTMCKITYKGTEKVLTKYGKEPKDVHQVSVQIRAEEEPLF